MPNASSHFGLGCAITTPVLETGAIDLRRLTSHALNCLASGCDSLTVFGTTGEGTSFGIPPRQAAFGALLEAGIDPATQLLSGVMALSDEDSAAQAEVALKAGCRGLLIAPPSYFRAVSEDALFAWYAKLLQPLSGRTRVYLYHIPQMTGVSISVSLIGRLRQAFPPLIACVKDSSGDWDNTAALLAHHRDLQILVGDERLLARAVREGGSGTICGVSNAAPQILLSAAKNGQDDPRIASLVDAILRHPVTPAVKALVAHRYGDMGWLATRAPLPALSSDIARNLGSEMDAILGRPLAA